MVRITRGREENFTCPHCGTQYRVTVSLPARDKDGKAEKVVKKLDVTFKNEW